MLNYPSVVLSTLSLPWKKHSFIIAYIYKWLSFFNHPRRMGEGVPSR